MSWLSILSSFTLSLSLSLSVFSHATSFQRWHSYVFNCAFNATAFVEDIRHTAVSHGVMWPGWAFPVLYHGTLLVLGLVAYSGAGAFAKVNTLLFVTLITAILITFGSIIFGYHGSDGKGRIISRMPIDCRNSPDTIMDKSDPYYQTHLINSTFYGPGGMVPNSSTSLLISNLWPHRDIAGEASKGCCWVPGSDGRGLQG